jgi:hypothetical protein
VRKNAPKTNIQVHIWKKKFNSKKLKKFPHEIGNIEPFLKFAFCEFRTRKTALAIILLAFISCLVAREAKSGIFLWTFLFWKGKQLSLLLLTRKYLNNRCSIRPSHALMDE